MERLKPLTMRVRALIDKAFKRPGDLTPDDISELREFDPWYAKAAVAHWRRYQREQEYEIKYQKRLPGAFPRARDQKRSSDAVVRLDPRVTGQKRHGVVRVDPRFR